MWLTIPEVFTICPFKKYTTSWISGSTRFFPSSYTPFSILSPHGPKMAATVPAIPGRPDNI